MFFSCAKLISTQLNSTKETSGNYRVGLGRVGRTLACDELEQELGARILLRLAETGPAAEVDRLRVRSDISNKIISIFSCLHHFAAYSVCVLVFVVNVRVGQSEEVGVAVVGAHEHVLDVDEEAVDEDDRVVARQRAHAHLAQHGEVERVEYLEELGTDDYEYALLARAAGEHGRVFARAILELVLDHLGALLLVGVHGPQLDGAADRDADDDVVLLVGERVDAQRLDPLRLLARHQQVDDLQAHRVHDQHVRVVANAEQARVFAVYLRALFNSHSVKFEQSFEQHMDA